MDESEVRKYRSMQRGRPDHAVRPGPAQESVWDYPRPPRVERCTELVRVVHRGQTIADSGEAFRVLETASPPTFYIPAADVDVASLRSNDQTTFCEWKGRALYWDLHCDGEVFANVAWSYRDPWAGFDVIRDAFAFFAGRLDACFVGEERVRPQKGDFYGGWVTSQIVGPFKGEPGTEGW